MPTSQLLQASSTTQPLHMNLPHTNSCHCEQLHSEPPLSSSVIIIPSLTEFSAHPPTGPVSAAHAMPLPQSSFVSQLAPGSPTNLQIWLSLSRSVLHLKCSVSKSEQTISG